MRQVPSGMQFQFDLYCAACHCIVIVQISITPSFFNLTVYTRNGQNSRFYYWSLALRVWNYFELITRWSSFSPQSILSQTSYLCVCLGDSTLLMFFCCLAHHDETNSYLPCLLCVLRRYLHIDKHFYVYRYLFPCVFGLISIYNQFSFYVDRYFFPIHLVSFMFHPYYGCKNG